MRRVVEVLHSPLFTWAIGNFILLTVIDVLLRFEPWLTYPIIVVLVFSRLPGLYKWMLYKALGLGSSESTPNLRSLSGRKGTTNPG
jgi:hypothetical protein